MYRTMEECRMAGLQGSQRRRRPGGSPMHTTRIAVVIIAGLFCLSADRAPVGWSVWGGDQGGTHYSTLADINTSNVSRLRQAWTWKTGEAELKEYGTRPGMFENTPLMVD